jgi:hypothetical protein
MGIMGAPLYGQDIGSAIEQVEKAIAKIKTNRFGKSDLEALTEANNEIVKALSDAYKD